MSSSKIEVKLTDIWFECQKELIEMKNKINGLKNCLKTSEQINKHLLNCNQFLLNIIEKCKLEEQTNNKINVLIKTIKIEEDAIENEKTKLRDFKRQIRSEFNDQTVIQLIADWKQCKRPMILTEDKSIQTIGYEQTLRIKSEFSGTDVKIELNDIKTEVNSIQEVNSSVDIPQLNQISNIDSPENDNIIDNSNDFDINDNSVDYNPDSNCSQSDTEIENNCDSDHKSAAGQTSKSRSKTSNRTKRINLVVLPYKEGDLYVCKGFDCDFTSGVKRKFYTHINGHHRGVVDKIMIDSKEVAVEDGKYVCVQNDCYFRTNTMIRLRLHSKRKHKIEIPLSGKHQRMKLKISPFKVGKEYVCKQKDCHFKCTSGQTFYSHFMSHSTLVKRVKAEPKSNDSERPYVCDWPECGWAFKKGAHLRLHRKRHLGHKDYKCDWPGCGAQMYTSHNYMTHRRTHTNERPLKCEWPGCIYTCNQNWALIAHKRIHTGEKPYLCPFPDCGYRCSQPCTLISHKRKHTGEKPYGCDVRGCNKRFSTLAGIWSHKKTHEKRARTEFKHSMCETPVDTVSKVEKQTESEKSSEESKKKSETIVN